MAAAAKPSAAAGAALNIADLQKSIDMDGDGQIDPEEQEILDLLKTMDVDGDGTIGLRELVNLGNVMNQQKKEVGRLQKMVWLIAGLCLVFCAVMFVVCFAAVEAGKDSKPSSDGTLTTVATKTGTEMTVATNANINPIGLADISGLGVDTLKNIKNLGFQFGATFYYFTVSGFEQKVEDSSATVTLKFSTGDNVVCTETAQTLNIASSGANVDLTSAEARRLSHRRALLGDRHLLMKDNYMPSVACHGDHGRPFDPEEMYIDPSFDPNDALNFDSYENYKH